MEDQAPYHLSKPTKAPTKAAACGLPIDYTLTQDEPVIFNTSGNGLHDRVQITISLRQFWLVIEALQHLRSAGLKYPEGHGTIPAQLSELSGQAVAFWEAIMKGEASHAGAHARALRLSNRDGFHSSEADGSQGSRSSVQHTQPGRKHGAK